MYVKIIATTKLNMHTIKPNQKNSVKSLYLLYINGAILSFKDLTDFTKKRSIPKARGSYSFENHIHIIVF
jgi:hypothetical protein